MQLAVKFWYSKKFLYIRVIHPEIKLCFVFVMLRNLSRRSLSHFSNHVSTMWIIGFSCSTYYEVQCSSRLSEVFYLPDSNLNVRFSFNNRIHGIRPTVHGIHGKGRLTKLMSCRTGDVIDIIQLKSFVIHLLLILFLFLLTSYVLMSIFCSISILFDVLL